VCDRFVVAEAELSAAPPGRTARLVLELGYADAQVAAVARDLAHGVLRQIEAMLADPAADLPAAARAALTARADAPAEKSAGGATVIALGTPLTRARRAHPAGRGR
jgi:hypothetical protein